MINSILDVCMVLCFSNYMFVCVYVCVLCTDEGCVCVPLRACVFVVCVCVVNFVIISPLICNYNIIYNDSNNNNNNK